MYCYKCEIKSGPLLEVKYYKSLRKRNAKTLTRKKNSSLSSEHQKIANQKRAERNLQRLILCNFVPGDYFIRFNSPYKKWTEEEFEKEVKNFFRRIKNRTKKIGKDFKYIGICECGKSGTNWHLHICIKKEVFDIVMECWRYPEGIDIRPLYEKGNFKDLAKYIRKDTSSGKKRIKTSRNLTKPEYNCKRTNKKSLRKLEKGDAEEVLNNYTKEYSLIEDERYDNDYTGANFNFVFMKKNCFAVNRKAKMKRE